MKDLANAPPNSEQKLAVLRVLRMLEDKSGRNDEVVKQYMAKRWSEQFHGQRDIQAQLMAHLDYALNTPTGTRSGRAMRMPSAAGRRMINPSLAHSMNSANCRFTSACIRA
jgi:type VI protein secretion system component VasK